MRNSSEDEPIRPSYWRPDREGGERSTAVFRITDPLGHTEKIEYAQYPYGSSPYANGLSYTDPNPPAGMLIDNAEMEYGNTYVWDPTVYAQYPNDYAKAQIDHWMKKQGTDAASRVVAAVKYPLQHWRWYSYPGQPWGGWSGTLDMPSAIGVQLGDGGTSLTTLDRNPIGKVTERINPDGYATVYTYAANNVDLLKVQQEAPRFWNGCGTLSDCTTSTSDTLPDECFSAHKEYVGEYVANYYYYSTPPVYALCYSPPTASSKGSLYYCNASSCWAYSGTGTMAGALEPGSAVTHKAVTLATYTYNAQHEPLTATNASGETTTYTYNAAGQLTSRTDPLGHTTQYVYDSAGYLTSIINPNGQTQASFTYDADGRVASYTNAAGTTVDYSYDALNRLTGITYPDGTTRTYTYQNLNIVAIKNRLGETTQYGYDADGHLISVTTPTGAVTHILRNADEKVTGITDPNGHTTTWARDIEERVTSRVGPLQHTTVWTYGDGAGRLQQVTDALGQTAQYTYTLGGKVSQIQYLHARVPTAPVSFTYGQNFPHLIAMTDGTGTTHYTYGAIGKPGALLLASVLTPLPQATVDYQYDADDRLINRSINGIQETYGYDALNRLITDTNTLGSFSYSYLGQTDLVSAQTLASSPVTVSYQYLSPSNDDRLAGIVNTIGTSSVASFSYTTNALDEITGMATGQGGFAGGRGAYQGRGGYEGDGPRGAYSGRGAYQGRGAYEGRGRYEGDGPRGPYTGRGRPGGSSTATLTYDGDQRLTATSGTLFGTTGYTYDGSSNLLTVTNTARSFTGTYDAANELTTANNQTLTYDADGELISDGTDTFTWDAAHRLASVTNTATGTTTAYTYNGLDERVGTTVQTSGATPVTTATLWCGTTICAAFDASNTLTNQYFPQGEIDGSQAYLYTRNNVGSVTALVTPQGTVAGQYRYSPYGQMTLSGSTTSSTPIPAFGYAGMVTDHSTGLNLTLYRAYDPQLRRWLSRDPVGQRVGLLLAQRGLAMPAAVGANGARWVGLNLAVNRYPYVGNDPLNWVDPHGDITFKQWSFTLLSAYCIAIFRPADIPEAPTIPPAPPSVATQKK